MAYGKYLDYPLEDSLFLDDILRMQEEMDEEIRQNENGTEDKRGTVGAALCLFGLIAVFLLWFFFG